MPLINKKMNAERILFFNKKASASLSKILEAVDSDATYKHLRDYIKYKFILEDEDFCTDDILQLSVKSISRMLEIDPGLLEKIDATGCQKSNSVIEKKIMLLIMLEKKLNVQIPEERGGKISTIRQLSDEIFYLRNNKDG